MDKDECGSSGVWKFFLDISLADVVLSVFYCDYLQVGLCYVAYYLSAAVDCYLDQIEDL